MGATRIKAEQKKHSMPNKITPETTEFAIPKENLFEVVKMLHEDKKFDYDYLSFMTAVDFIDYFEMVYQFYSYKRNHGLMLKSSALKKDPVIDSITPIYGAADWHEREVYDLFGIDFVGHPDLRRILLADDFKGHPLRKDFKCVNDEEYILE